MGFLSKFEGKMEDTVEGAADRLGGSPISPVQIAKKAEKQMRRNKMVGAGKQYAPTLYTVLVSMDDDDRLFGYYPTLAGETETYLSAKASEHGLAMDGQPLVRFIPDEGLKHGKFEVIAEMVAAPLVAQLREEEMERYGIAVPPRGARGGYRQQPAYAQPRPQFQQPVYDEPAYDEYGYDELAQQPAYEEPVRVNRAAPEGPAFVAPAPGEPAYGEAPKTMVFDQQPAPDEEPLGYEESPLDVYLYDMTHDAAFPLDGKPAVIGRESKSDIVIPDINASREHAEIRMEPSTGAWILVDLGSTNGTFVNGRRIKSISLHDADMIIVGTTELEFQQLS